MNRWFILLLLLPLLLFSAGCWDQIEIEQRGFVVGTALDKGEDGKIIVTFQLVLPTLMQSSSGTKAEGGEPYINTSSEAKTVFKAARLLASEVSRTPYIAHNQMIIVSDELASSEHLGELLDLFIRDPESRRASNIMVAQGKARDILEVKTDMETLPVQYILSTHNNPEKSEAITPPINIGDLHQMLLSNSSYALPKVSRVKENKISTAGASVFNGKDHKFIGHLTEDETTGRNMIQGTVKTASLELEIEGKDLVVEIHEFHRRIKVKTDQRGLPLFEITVGANGSIGESEFDEMLTIKEMNNEIKRKTEEKIKSFMEQVIEVSQKQFQSDFLGFNNKLYEQNYDLWNTYRDDWDRGENIYSQCKVTIDVKLSLKTIGTIMESK